MDELAVTEPVLSVLCEKDAREFDEVVQIRIVLARALVGASARCPTGREIPRVRPAVTPRPNCHDAVDPWVATHPESQAVRGWLAVVTDGPQLLLCAHSVIRLADGGLIDVTFSEHEPALPFVPHPCAAADFFRSCARRGRRTSCASTCAVSELAAKLLLILAGPHCVARPCGPAQAGLRVGAMRRPLVALLTSTRFVPEQLDEHD